MSVDSGISRRDFLKTSALAGGGLIIACYLPVGSRDAVASTGPLAPNAFLRIGVDERITVFVHKAEMGQGVYTSLPMLVAEELCCDWQLVSVQPSPVAPEYNHTWYGSFMFTGGSTSIRSEWDRLSAMGAAAREMLISAAAGQWGLEPRECSAENGYVIGPGKRRLSFGRLVDAASKLPIPEHPHLKGGSPSLLGKPVKRLDSPAKIHGNALFGIDVYEPGMLTAVIVRAPVFGAQLKSFDSDTALEIKGVQKIVDIGTGVAVVADGFWPAVKGASSVRAVWDLGDRLSLDTDTMRKDYLRQSKKPGQIAHRAGNASRIIKQSKKRIDVEYDVPYLAHAPMEPLNCFVDLHSDHCIIRTGSQSPSLDRDAAAREAGLKPEQISFETTYLGGGFGRRASPSSDFVVEAVKVAKALGRPVKVIWTREDDIKGGHYRPMYVHRVSVSLDKGGRPSAWLHRIVGQSIMVGTPFANSAVKNGIDETSVQGVVDTPYEIPHFQVELHTVTNRVPVLWWRSAGHSHTAFVMESVIDECAYAAGKDPYLYRRNLLMKSPRVLNVLDAAARNAEWSKPLPKGRARGIAVHQSFGSIVAQVAEVSFDPVGLFWVDRIVCVIDCGRVVNPDTVKAQMESGITFGLSAALYGEITLKSGFVVQSDFNDYRVTRLLAMPKIDTQIIESDQSPGGVGETGVPPVAPAVANALYAVVRSRIRSLPLTLKKLKTSHGQR